MRPKIYSTQRKAINAARKAYGDCRTNDVAWVHRGLSGYPSHNYWCEGYVVCPRDGDRFVHGLHEALGLLPQEEILLVSV